MEPYKLLLPNQHIETNIPTTQSVNYAELVPKNLRSRDYYSSRIN